MAIDEECWSAIDPERARLSHVISHALPRSGTLKVAFELRYIQAKFLRVPFYVLRFKLALILKQLVVHLPKLTLIACRFGRQRGAHGVIVNGSKRHVLPNNLHLILVDSLDLFQGRTDLPTERSLEV